MDTVPVMIITLCRYDHFVRCVESLKNNSLAAETDLYIGLDYPLKAEHWDGYRKICSYLEKDVQGFRNVYVVKQEKNIGATENAYALREEVFKKYDCYIFSEDDNEFAPNYLEYMNKCMNYYKDDSKVIAVAGYMYPIDTSGTKGSIIMLSTYFSAFGYGIYRRNSDLLEQEINMDNFIRFYRNPGMMRKLRKASANQYGNFVKSMLEYTGDELIRDGEIRKIDLSYGLYMFFHNYYTVFPVISKVRNYGFDGSGIHCNVQAVLEDMEQGSTYRCYDYSKQEFDKENRFQIDFRKEDMEKIDWNRRLSDFFQIPGKEEWITVISYYVSLIIGRKAMAALIKKITKLI